MYIDMYIVYVCMLWLVCVKHIFIHTYIMYLTILCVWCMCMYVTVCMCGACVHVLVCTYIRMYYVNTYVHNVCYVCVIIL